MKRVSLQPGTAGFLLMALMLLVNVKVAAASEYQSHEAIRQAVKQFLQTQLQGQDERATIVVGRIDSRLKLRACAEPLKAYLPVGGRTLGNVTVGVRCESPKAWSLIVQARVSLLAPVLVSARPLGRGAVIGSGDVEFAERDLARLTSGYFEDPEALYGMEVKRSIRAGMPISPNMVAQAKVISRGERVTIVAATGSLEVRMEGEALEDGVRGGRIRVRNLSSKRVIDAEVVGPGLVRVRF